MARNCFRLIRLFILKRLVNINSLISLKQFFTCQLPMIKINAFETKKALSQRDGSVIYLERRGHRAFVL